MPSDFEQMLRDAFGELTQFSNEQVRRLQAKTQEFAREALKDELTKLHAEIADLRNRVAALEAERVRDAAETV
jgi:polyhydroxyalkanoate synthesis regulator phasin